MSILLEYFDKVSALMWRGYNLINFLNSYSVTKSPSQYMFWELSAILHTCMDST